MTTTAGTLRFRARLLAIFLTAFILGIGGLGVLAPSTVVASPAVVKMKSHYKPGEIVVKVSARKLYYVYEKGKAYAYPIATPARAKDKRFGKTKITQKRPNPTWYPTDETRARNKKLPYKVKAGDKRNALGEYALNLGWDLIRIHGTNAPSSIGSAASGGCYRMFNKDVKHLASRVRVGTPVRVLK